MTITLRSGRRIPIAPREGWLTLGLVMLLCLSFAWALDDARLVLGDPDLTDFLAWTAVGGVLAGFLGAAVGWGRWRTYLIGAAFAGLLTPLLVGWVMVPEGAPPGVLFGKAAYAAVDAWRDLIVEDRLLTDQYGHHLLLLGCIVWGSSMFASFASFGHRRPVNGVLLIGLLLVANMTLTTRDQLVYLVLYSVSALFLLIRFHTFDEQSEWIRRRIGDPGAVSTLYLRGGTIFIVTAVLGSLLLTNVAASDPLAGAWTDMGGRVIEWSRFLEKYLPVSGSGRSIGPSFGSSARVVGVWTTNDDPALTWRASAPLQQPPYLAAAYYDVFELQGWAFSPTTAVPRPAGQELLADTTDAVASEGRREYTVSITPQLSRSLVFAPGTPSTVDADVTVQLVGDQDGYLAQLERATSRDPYRVTALISADEKDGGPTQNQLRAAGRDYPDGMLERYGRAAVPDGTFTTPASRALLAEMVAVAGDNPYDLAATMVDTLHDSSRFSYDTDVRDMRCGDLSIVDCFVVNARGYCEYYASTMAMMLRELDIPARLVEGFLPGSKDPSGTVYTVRNSDSHAWVQVYFPGHGWIDFDPTGGNRAALAPLPTGAPVATATPGPRSSATRGPRPSETEKDINEPGGSVTRSGRNGTPVGPFIVIAVLLVVALGALASVAWRRGPRGAVTADGAYGMVTRFGSRFGFAPRPNQTVYEYSGALAEVLPDARPQLETVARAKVEVAYGGRDLTTDRLAALREAQARLRTQLLRLAFRRQKWRRPR